MGEARHCPQWEEKLSLYVDGVLNPFDENAVEAHLARCAGCRETVKLWRAVGQAVRCIPQAAPPAYLREWILASTSRRPRRVPRRARFPWRVLAPAIAGALLLGWLTLPRPTVLSVAPDSPPSSVSGFSASVPAPTSVLPGVSPFAPLVVILPAHPIYRTATLAPRWIAQTRLSTATDALETAPVALQTPEQLLSAATATPTADPALAGTGGSSITPTIGGVLPPTVMASPYDPTEWLRQPDLPRPHEQRNPSNTTTRNQNRLLVPIVTIEWK